MTAVVALDSLLDTRRVWRGQAIYRLALAASKPTGIATLDEFLPGGGWPESAISEFLVAATGIGRVETLLRGPERLATDMTTAGGRWCQVIALLTRPAIPQALAGRGCRPRSG